MACFWLVQSSYVEQAFRSVLRMFLRRPGVAGYLPLLQCLGLATRLYIHTAFIPSTLVFSIAVFVSRGNIIPVPHRQKAVLFYLGTTGR